MSSAPDDLIPTKEVISLFPTRGRPARSTLLKWARRGAFPMFFKLSPRLFLWSKGQVVSWLQARGFIVSEVQP